MAIKWAHRDRDTAMRTTGLPAGLYVGKSGGAGLTKDVAFLRAKKKPCACCGTLFRPTLKRRMLCVDCYRNGGPADDMPD